MTKKKTIASPLKTHGGKHYLASKIVALMPKHTHYVEAYAGGLSVLLAKEFDGISEVVNDIHQDLTIFWRVLAGTHFEEFQRIIEATPFSESRWREAKPGELKVARGDLSVPAAQTAANFFIYCRQSLAGRMKDFATVSRNRTRRRMNEQVSAWLTSVEGLADVHMRLKRVLILNREAVDVIQQQDGKKTLFYLDPPYLHETRASIDAYAHEMTPEQHARLLGTLLAVKGKFLLSGYRSKLYDDVAKKAGWNRHDFVLPNNSAGGKVKRRMTECVWCNF